MGTEVKREETPKGAEIRVEIGPAEAGGRLDGTLAHAVPAISRARLKRLILSGQVRRLATGLPATDPSAKVKAGEIFALQVPEPVEVRLSPQRLPLEIVYEDAHLIVLDKPPGLVVHPAAGNPDRTLVNALLAHCGTALSGIGGVQRPGIVHRLDKDTSGLMVVAKTDRAHASFAAQFAAHSVERAYRALVWGVPRPREGEIAGKIGRSPNNRKKMAVLKQGGKDALTRYRVIETFGHGAKGAVASLVECRLATGRTHQIRVHLSAIGHPVMGDPVYGRATPERRRGLTPAAGAALDALGRQALDAYLLGFIHPDSAKPLRFEKKFAIDIMLLKDRLEEI